MLVIFLNFNNNEFTFGKVYNVKRFAKNFVIYNQVFVCKLNVWSFEFTRQPSGKTEQAGEYAY